MIAEGPAEASVRAVEMKTCHLWLVAAVALLAIAGKRPMCTSRD